MNINDAEITVGRLALKGWIELNALQEKMTEAVSKHDYDSYFELMVRFVETASVIGGDIDWEAVAWHEMLMVFSEAVKMNTVSKEFPILNSKGGKREKLPWEYEGRSWYFWLNLFASNYGWSEDVVANLDVETAIGLYQETVIDEQMRKEWSWGLSEIAYPYDPATKTQRFKALERPNWMLPIAPAPKTVKMRKDMMPQGSVINLTEKDDGNQLP